MHTGSRRVIFNASAHIAPAAIALAYTLSGAFPAPLTAVEFEEPCILDLSLRPLAASRDAILVGHSSQLDWSVTFPANPSCANRVSVFLLHAGRSDSVSDEGTKSVSPTETTSYRLKAVDRLQTDPRWKEKLLGDAVTVTVFPAPPSPPRIDCP